MALKEKHGLDGIRSTKAGRLLAVIVTDVPPVVKLGVSDALEAALLTPEEARYIAKQLITAARRVEWTNDGA